MCETQHTTRYRAGYPAQVALSEAVAQRAVVAVWALAGAAAASELVVHVALAAFRGTVGGLVGLDTQEALGASVVVAVKVAAAA